MGLHTASPATGYFSSRYTQPTVQSATPSAWTTGNSPITLFTVTGTILCRLYGTVGATGFTSTGTTGTLSVGTSGNVAVLMPATTANGTNLVASVVWVDATATTNSKILATGTTPWVEVNANILLTIATNSMTAGSVNLYLDWIPVSAGATVVSGSP